MPDRTLGGDGPKCAPNCSMATIEQHLGSASRLLRLLRTLATLLIPLLCVATVSGQSVHEQVGYTLLKSRLGSNLPLGDGGVISQVEAKQGGNYLVDVTDINFTATYDPFAMPTSIVVKSGNTGNSNHARGMATRFYGNFGSMAPGANNVDLYEADHWLTSVLKYNTVTAPTPQPYRVQNHSWISPGLSNATQDLSALRRFDYLIETGEMTAAVGTNNYVTSNPGTHSHPKLLAHSYNAIVVGRSDGLHSRGVTTFASYGPGRYRPDIVAPEVLTSRSTATVSSAAALLADAADGTDAARSETIKALLLAGATKSEFDGFIDPVSSLVNSWVRTPTQPLDDLFGAGELNIYNSYLAHLGGQQPGSESEPAESVGSYGWDYQDFKANAAVGDVYYNFEIPAGSTAKELSIILAWNAEITDTPASGFTPSESLQNLDLRFYDSTTSFLGTEIDSSVSTEHNVEHIYLTDLAPGTYTLAVSGAAEWDYGLAWRTATLFDEVSADFNEDGYIDGADLMAWQRHVGMLISATHADGDSDGDGDVDNDDLQNWKDGIMPAPPAQAVSAGVPEPASLALAALAAGFVAVLSLRSRKNH
jgi:hypothetical protein